MEETVIKIREDQEFTSIERYRSGLKVGTTNKVRIDELLGALMGMMEHEDLVRVLTNGDVKSTLKSIIQPLVEDLSTNPEAVHEIFQLVLQRISSDTDPKIIGMIFAEIANKFHLYEINPENTIKLLHLILNNMNQINEPEFLQAMFLELIKKLSIYETHDDRLLNTILQQVSARVHKEDQTEIIHGLFQTLAAKVPKEWMREILAPYLAKERIVKSPILPQGCVLYQEELSGKQIIVIHIQKQRWNVQYHNTAYSQVGHPALLFIFQVSPGTENRTVSAQIVAVKDQVIKPTTKFYHYPFSNVFDTFSACWPDLHDIRINDLYQLTTLPFLFLSSPSNDHLYRGENLRELFASLEGNDFESTILEDAGVTFGEFFEMNNTENA